MTPAIGQKTLFGDERPVECMTPIVARPIRNRVDPPPSPESIAAHARAVRRELAFDIRRGVEPHADGVCRADGVCTEADLAAALAREARAGGDNQATAG